MTTQTAVFSGLPTGQTLTAKLFTLADPDTLAYTADSVTERTNALGEYVASFGEVAAISGDHTLILFVGSSPVGIGKRTFAGADAEVATVTPEVAVLDSAEREAIADEVESRELTLAAAYDAAKTAASQTSVNDVPTVAEFEARTLESAAYATSAQINSLNVNTRANISVPIEIETPDSGTQIYKVRLFLFDVAGNMEAPDSDPTVALVNAAGTDRASRLSAASNPSTGVYSWDYTATDDDAEEQLNWTFTVVEAGLTRVYPATSYVVEETAYRFTSTDRATLNSRASQTAVDDIPTNAELATALSGKATTSDVTTVGTAVAAVDTKIGTPVVSVSSDIAAVKADTDSLLTRITSGITALIANLTAMITGSGASAKYTTVAMSNVTGGGGGSGTESDLMVSTTIAAISSQTVFTLTDGSPDNDAYNDQLVVITDADTSTQKSRGIVSDYVAFTKTITLRGAPGFTIAAGDAVAIIAIGSDVSSTQLAGAVSSAIATAGVPVTVTGVPSFLRVGDARTVANGSAIPVRLYSADDDSLLFGLGTQLFEDATITFSLRRSGNDGTEGAEEAVIPCTWVASGGDGYVLIAYEGDALDGCDAMDKVKEKDCHRWGIKFQWGDADPITPVFGNVSVLRKIVSTQ